MLRAKLVYERLITLTTKLAHERSAKARGAAMLTVKVDAQTKLSVKC